LALAQLNWFSKTLAKMVTTNVVLPDTGGGPFATFYLLHGLSDDHTAWLRRTRVEWYAAKYPLVIVMPDGFRGWYTTNDAGPDYAKYVGEELVAEVERLFPVKRSRSARAIGGLSMGGYGALRLALGYPDTFGSATSHSGALCAGVSPTRVLCEREEAALFGDTPARRRKHSLVDLARQLQKAGKSLPRMRIDCGTEDHRLPDNRAVHAKFDAMRAPHEYAEYPGQHDWDYWDAHVQEALAFHARAMKLGGT
jgi:putative tributyrin esterase